VAEPGPFSSFPGIDRTLSVLEGNGIRLDIAGTPVTLVRGSPPLPFAADIPVYGMPIDGGIVDLNVMTRRGRFRHQVSHLTGVERLAVTSQGTTTLILAVTAIAIGANETSAAIPAGATARFDQPAGQGLDITAAGPIAIFVIDFFAL
jgi:environmental stress-induced protein Ves